MPLRVTCQCGQSLNVPDNLAGKVVKCPKCQKGVKVPGQATGGTSGSPPKLAESAAKKATVSAKPVRPPAASPPLDALAGLFDSAGLTERKGTFCPSCDKSLPPGTAICVNCGFHLEQGAKISGFQVESKEFGNARLVEASEMMKREAETEKRLLGAGTPWWMMFGLLAGLVVMIGAVLIKMDATTSGNVSNVLLFRKLQNATFLSVLAMSFGVAMTVVSVLGLLAILITAFLERTKEGLLCLIPGYIVYYMFSRMQAKRLTNTVMIIWVTAILGGIALGYSLPNI